MMNLKNVVLFDKEYKEWLLKKAEKDNLIDKHMLDLCNAINSIEDLVTMNCCQGHMIPEEKHNHCPINYVDFFVLNHNYNVANNLFARLKHKLGGEILCRVDWEEDTDLHEDENGEEYVEDNGLINMRYRIELLELNPEYKTGLKLKQDIIDIINDYKNAL
ncbi:hypothetical protein ACWTV9_10250 [Clostridioides difficile]|nr:hypothetical protein KW95_14015 [Clostridioides difficile]